MSSTPRHAIVVGGGVIGAFSAYYLQQAGWRVTILDQAEFGKACSHGNCGFICPSHVLPLAAPGAVRGAIRALLSPHSPFAIRLRLDPSLWTWLYTFARRCKQDCLVESAHAIQALLNSSRALYDKLLADEPLTCEFERRGLLFVLQTPAAMEHYAHTDQLLRDSFQMPAVRYDGDDVSRLEPALKTGLAGGWHYEGDAHLRPDRLMASLKQLLTSRGATIHERCTVTGLSKNGRGASALVTSQGEMPGDAFVFATGTLTPLLKRELGCKLPIQPGKGYSLTMPRPARCPVIPLIFEEHRVAVTPMQTGYRLGSTMEFAGYDRSIQPRRLALLKAGAEPYLHEPYCDPIEETWYGWRPMTPDSKPIIDRAPQFANVVIAAGHNMLGLSMGPGTGQLVAELINEKRPHLDVQPFRVTRFS